MQGYFDVLDIIIMICKHLHYEKYFYFNAYVII